MKKPKLHFTSNRAFANFLRDTLIPDLEDSHLTATANDFEKVVQWLESPLRFRGARDFVSYLRRVGKDYLESGREGIAADYAEAAYRISVKYRLGDTSLGSIDPGMLDQFTGTEEYHPYSRIFPRVKLSDGALYVAKNGGRNGAFWLMDAIASQIPLAAKKHRMCQEMQFWTLKVNLKKQSAVLTCVPDAGEKPVVIQRIPYTDFDLPEIKFYVGPIASGWLIYLPSEY